MNVLDWIVQANEPEEWANALELERDALAALDTAEIDIQRSLSESLAAFRARALEQLHAQQAIDDAFVKAPAKSNGTALHHDQDEEEPTNRFTFETWAEFRDHTDEEISYLVDGLIPNGSLVFLASEPKAGKTWLSLSLAVACATGTKYLGRFAVPEECPVLYLALEGNRTDYRTRLGALARGQGVNPDGFDLRNLTISYQPLGIDLMDPAWARDLLALVTLYHVGIVFVDVLRDGAPRLREDGQGSGDFATIKAHLKPLLKEGVSVVLVHHFSKRNESTKKRSIGELMSGSGALFGACDLVMGITTGPKQWEEMRVEFIGRATPAPDPFNISIVGNRTGKYGGFRYVDTMKLATKTEDSSVPIKSDWAHAVPMAKWIRSQERRVFTHELVTHFKVAKSTIHDHLEDLEKVGVVHHVDETDNRKSGFEVTL